MVRSVFLLLMIVGMSCCAAAQPGPVLDRSRLELAFVEEFEQPPSFWDAKRNPTGRWKTNYYFSFQDTNHPRGWEARTLVPNEEAEYYGDPHENMGSFSWADGALTIVGKPNPYREDPRTNKLPYLSGLITTEKSFSQETGYFEARMAFPVGKGLWPAFWLLPKPDEKDGWAQFPGHQEIDIIEFIGEPGKLYFTLFNDKEGKKERDGTEMQTGIDVTQYHTYGVLLTHDEVVWYLDDREMWRRPNRDFRRPAYMLLNLAVGGKWPGYPDSSTKFPAEMKIDWVRAYRLK